MSSNSSGRPTRVPRPGPRIAIVAVVSVGAACLLAGCGSSSTTADKDQSYLREVAFGAVPFNNDTAAIRTGRDMCDQIERAVHDGQTVVAAKASAKAEANQAGRYSDYHNSTIMVAAVTSYCPEYMSDK